MDEGIAGAVEAWETRPFSDGYRGLRELLDRGFSGAVEADGCWLLAINGRAVGVFEEYETADGYEQERADVERFEGATGTVYEAPEPVLPLLFAMRLSDGELVERGTTTERSLREVHREYADAGFTGYLELSEHVMSGDYYVVYQGGRSTSVGFLGRARRLLAADEAFDRACEEAGVFEVRAVGVEVVELPDAAAPADGVGDAGEGTARGSGESDESAASDADAVAGDAPPATDGAPGAAVGAEETVSGPSVGAVDAAPVEAGGEADATTGADPAEAATGTSEEAVDDSTGTPAGADGAAGADVGPEAPAEPDTEPDGDATTAPAPSSGPAERAPAGEASAAELRERVEALAAEQERLAETVAAVEARLDRLVGDGERAVEAERELSPAEALAETTLLVRARSETGPTLADLGAGDEEMVDRASFVENLHLDPRTTFDAATTAVEGRPFDAFLETSLAYRFVDWLVRLPFTIREAGARGELGPLYDALARADRATFGSGATVGDREFDVAVRDTAGEPLVVARLADAPEPPDEAAVESLLQAARDAREAADGLAAAFLVTTSFVDGGALGPVREATKSGVLSRDKRASYVNLSGGGFHVCLVEAGSESFHLAVPDL